MRTEQGWTFDPGSAQAARLDVTHADDWGAGGPALQEAIADCAGPLLACGEARFAQPNPPDRVTFHVDLRSGQGEHHDPLGVDIRPREEAALRRCLDAALRSRLPRPADDEGAVASFVLIAPGGERRVGGPFEDRLVSVHFGGACWQWEQEPPCPPNKRCHASKFVRTSCGEPTQREDVTLHFGLGPPQGDRAAPSDVRLLGGDGTVLWLTALPGPLAERYGPRFVVGEASVALHASDVAFGVRYGVDQIVIADGTGVHSFDRRRGTLLASWTAPVPPRKMWFDGGEYKLARKGVTECEGDAGQGAFFRPCRDGWLFFDGFTAAYLAGDPLSLRAATDLDASKSLVSGDAVSPRARLRLDKRVLTIRGQVFME